MAECDVCFRKCNIPEGRTGFCRARICRDGEVAPLSYGCVTGLALDPIEKKPLRRFHPGSTILSVGSYGCNLCCPYCQNFEIARAFCDETTFTQEEAFVLYKDDDGLHRIRNTVMTPERICGLAIQAKESGNIGVAFTYNEPLIAYEFVLDTAKLIKAQGMKNVIVTNGCVSPHVAEKVLPFIDAVNVDLKCFSGAGYKDFLGGELEYTKKFIEAAAGQLHVELTTLIVPGFNDSEEEIINEAKWIASLNGGQGADISLHISRFFPRHKMADAEPTPVSKIYRLAELAGKYLRNVFTGNC